MKDPKEKLTPNIKYVFLKHDKNLSKVKKYESTSIRAVRSR